MEVGGRRHAPAFLNPWRRPDTQFIGGWVGPRADMDEYGHCRHPTGFDPQIVQTVASRYTNYAFLTHAVYNTDICKISG